MHKVIGPDLVTVCGPQAKARSVIQPQTAFLRLFTGNLQPLTSPQTLNPLVIDLPVALS